MKIAVVILNWNGKHFLENFLPSVISFSGEASIYVADNASNDDSIQFLSSQYPTVQIIENPTNGGFSKGYNLALQKIEADYYVLLNSDVEVTPNWITTAIDFLDNNPDVACLQPKIKSFHQREYFEYAGAAGGFLDCDGYPFCRGRIFDTLEKDEGQFESISEIMWASGACLFIRADLFHKVGGLDEDFFAHMEEIDLCWRLCNHGYKIVYFPQSEVFHVGGGTLDKSNSKKTYLNFRNSLFTLHKNYKEGNLPTKIFKRLILDGLAGFKFLISGQFKNIFAIVAAHFAYYRSIPSLNTKRRSMGQNFKPLLKPYSIVWGYYVKGKRNFKDFELVK